MHKPLTAAAAVLALGACTTMSDVMQIGPDTYMVSTSVRGGLTTDTEVKSTVIHKAQTHCGAMGKQMQMVTSNNSGTQGWTPQNAEVTFKCV